MLVEQQKKVRPVLDFRELNHLIECHTGDYVIDNCEETLTVEADEHIHVNC